MSKSQAPANPTRRRVLKGALWGGLAISSGLAVWQFSLTESVELLENESYPYRFLTEPERLLLWAIIPAYLTPALSFEDSDTRLRVLHNIDSAIAVQARSTQDELRQLLELLNFKLGKALIAGIWTSWNQASLKALQSFLTDWRESSLLLLRAGYLGLHQLIFGSYYGEPVAWRSIGYPGPPQFKLPDSFYDES